MIHDLRPMEAIGARWSLSGEGAFAKAALILRDPSDGALYSVRGADKTGAVHLKAIDEEGWGGLRRSGEAVAFPLPAQYQSGDVLWMLRPGFRLSREACVQLLRSRGVLRYEVPNDQDVVAVVVSEPLAVGVRLEWSHELFNRAWRHALEGRLDEAIEEGELSYSLRRPSDPWSLGLLALLHERRDEKVKADFYVGLARRSWGEQVAGQVVAERDRLRDELVREISARNVEHVSAPSPRAPSLDRKRLSPPTVQFQRGRFNSLPRAA